LIALLCAALIYTVNFGIVYVKKRRLQEAAQQQPPISDGQASANGARDECIPLQSESNT
jgi:hypothetical protein